MDSSIATRGREINNTIHNRNKTVQRCMTVSKGKDNMSESYYLVKVPQAEPARLPPKTDLLEHVGTIKVFIASAPSAPASN